MKRLSLFSFLIMALFAVSALAAPKPQRLRGTIQSFNHHQLVLHTRFGKTKNIALNDKTTYAYVVKSSLSKVNKNDYVGVATTKKNGRLVALELVIFPNSMRGTGEGHYSWDKLPNTTAQGKNQGNKLVSSSMTNGTVHGTSGTGGSHKLVSSSMTNGNVKSNKKAAGAREITVTYKSGKKRIYVPSSAPIVKFQKADSSALKKGAHVFVEAIGQNGQLAAAFVAVGKNGIKPPM